MFVNGVESINRSIDGSSWLGRAHAVRHARQLVNLLYALMVNSVALPLGRGPFAQTAA